MSGKTQKEGRGGRKNERIKEIRKKDESKEEM
jgi:hypothetical protein